MVDYAKIDEALKFLAFNGRERFNAHQVAYLSNNSEVNEVYQYLVSREPFILVRSYEVQCPNQHSTISVSSLDQIPQKWVECRICAEEFIPDPSNIFIVFDFNPSYLKQLQDVEQQQKNALRPMMVV